MSENDFWTPQVLFPGETVFCLASGPSLTQSIADHVRGRGRVIAINSSAYLAPWADVLFFTDNGWFEKGRDPAKCGLAADDDWPRRRFVAEFPGHVIALARAAKRVLPGKVKRIQCVGLPTDDPPRFPAPGVAVHQGRSSGHTAVSLAIALGAKRIVLLGYDMRLLPADPAKVYDDPPVGSLEERNILARPSHPRHYEIRARYREHHHAEYGGPRDLFIYETEFVPRFRNWNAAALTMGVTILNATPGSAIPEFPMVELDDVLEGRV